MSILSPGETCWTIGRADRCAFLVDNQSYFTAVYDALIKAKRSILLLGWGFDPRTRLAPDGAEAYGEADEVGRVLLKLAEARPELEIKLLIWKSALPVSATQEFFPHRARPWFKHSRVRFELDDAVPLGACHHQKVVIIDEQIAFTGGGDICADRWDSESHLDKDLRRRIAQHECHAPRHEVMAVVDGQAARQFGDLFRARWKRAVGEDLQPRPGDPADDPWPADLKPDLTGVETGIARTLPAWRGAKGTREIQALAVASIREAKSIIYLENQYFTSPIIAEALAARLADPAGPQVVLISTNASPSWFDRLTMDRVRGIQIRRLQEADVFGRFQVFSPWTGGASPIIVHAKVSIFDDTTARIGSANLNNRSAGFDTECELVVVGETPEQRAAIAALRDHLLGHYMSRSAADVSRAVGPQGQIALAIEALNRHHRLRPIVPQKLSKWSRIIADFHLGDPMSPKDSMRPYMRRRRLNRQVHTIAADGGVRRFIEQLKSRRSAADDRTPSE
jgi:phosphatidylserine/phosphatidylglycerophosphate/cardiolipin synthase-like enzyme